MVLETLALITGDSHILHLQITGLTEDNLCTTMLERIKSRTAILFCGLAVFRSTGPYILNDGLVVLITVLIMIGQLTVFHFKCDWKAAVKRFAVLTTVCFVVLKGLSAWVSMLLPILGLLVDSFYLDDDGHFCDDNTLANPKDWKGHIFVNMKTCLCHYNKGLSKIDRTNSEWKLKRGATIGDLHYSFVQAHKYMERASEKLTEVKNVFDTHLRDLVENFKKLSDEMDRMKICLRGLKASLESVEEGLKRKSDNLKDLERQLERKQKELEETNRKIDVAKKAMAAALGTAGGLLILAPFSAVALAGAAAAEATAIALLAVAISLDKDITSLRNRIDSSREIYRLTCKELEDLKEEERKTKCEESSREKKVISLKKDCDDVRQKTTEVSNELQQVKTCCTVLGVIVNKFETLKEESDPEYCINLSAIKKPVQELDMSIRQGRITF